MRQIIGNEPSWAPKVRMLIRLGKRGKMKWEDVRSEIISLLKC
jgi:hypothetical protein